MDHKQSWVVDARNEQEMLSIIYARLLDFDLLDLDSRKKLKTTIAYGFYKFPELVEVNERNFPETDNLFTLYSEEQKCKVELVVKKLIGMRNPGIKTVYLKNTILVCRLEDTFLKNRESSANKSKENANNSNEDFIIQSVVFAFSFDKSTFHFIDLCGRVYKDWTDFIKNNKLPPCWYCAPTNGIYEVDLKIQLRRSPSASDLHKLTDVTDGLSSIGAVGSAVVPLLATNPITLSVALGVGITAGAYGIMRSMYGLADRASHRQSIGITDPESRNCWMNIIAASLTAGTCSAVARSADLFQKYGKAATNGIKLLNGVTVAFDVVSFGNSMLDLWIKHREGEKITALDILNVSLQVMFLCGAVVNAKRLHNEMSNLSNVQVNKTMTKSQKKNAQKKRALARKRLEDPTYVKPRKSNKKKKNTTSNSNATNGADIKMSGKTPLAKSIPKEHNDMFMNFLRICPQQMFAIFRHYYNPAQNIYHHFVCIKSNANDFNSGTLDMTKFLTLTYQHVTNLYVILKEELLKLGRLLTNVNLFSSEKSKENACFILDNAVTEINSFEAESNEHSNDLDAYVVVTEINSFEAESNEHSNDLVTDVVQHDRVPFNARSLSIVDRLSGIVEQFTHSIRNLYKVYNLNDQLNSEAELYEVYISSLTETIDYMLLNLSHVNEEQFLININVYGESLAELIKAKENDKIFDHILSYAIKEINDLFYNNFQKTLSKQNAIKNDYTAASSKEISFKNIVHVSATIVKMLRTLHKVKSDSAIAYDLELVLLKELLSITSEKINAHSIDYVERNFSDITEDLLKQLQNDHRFNNAYYNSYVLSTTRNVVKIVVTPNDEDTVRHKKIMEISGVCYYKLLQSGFQFDNDTDCVFNVVTNFVTNKLLDALEQFQQANQQHSYCNNNDIFEWIADDMTNRCFLDDLFLAECIEFCYTRVNDKQDILVWKNIISDIGIDAHWCCDLEDITNDNYLKKLCEQLNVDWRYVDKSAYDSVNKHILLLKPKIGYVCDLEMIIVCKIPEKSEGFVICFKKNIVNTDTDYDDNDSD